MENGVNLSLRVFRRNNKNLIIVWGSASLDESLKKCTSAMLIGEDGRETLLTFSKFVPDSPEKFPKDIDGIVVSHAFNNMDPEKAYTVKLCFGDSSNKHEEIKDVDPVTNYGVPELPKAVECVHMYAFDYNTHKWVPFPADLRLPLED